MAQKSSERIVSPTSQPSWLLLFRNNEHVNEALILAFWIYLWKLMTTAVNIPDAWSPKTAEKVTTLLEQAQNEKIRNDRPSENEDMTYSKAISYQIDMWYGTHLPERKYLSKA